MGFMPNDALIMARHPALLGAFLGLVRTVYAPGAVGRPLKSLVGLMASAAAGCRYCAAHTSHSALAVGVEPDKLRELWQFQRSSHYSIAERAALELARQSALTTAVDEAAYAEFADHFSPAAQLELTAVLALFGFLNRWNRLLDTDIEAGPRDALDALGEWPDTGMRAGADAASP